LSVLRPVVPSRCGAFVLGHGRHRPFTLTVSERLVRRGPGASASRFLQGRSNCPFKQLPPSTVSTCQAPRLRPLPRWFMKSRYKKRVNLQGM